MANNPPVSATVRHIIFILPLLLFIIGCSGAEDSPGTTAVKFTLSSDNPDITILDNGRSASIRGIIGGEDYTLDISGDFVNIVFDTDVDWLSATYRAGTITIRTVADGDIVADTRTGKIYFTVFNDSRSASGVIAVTRSEATYEDLLSCENKAINYFLNTRNVVWQVPADNNFLTGDDAPYYVLSSTPIVAMKVIDSGCYGIPGDNERVYFRFSRVNLMTYCQTGGVAEDWTSPDPLSPPCSFILNDYISPSSAQWGRAIQMPLLYGLGYGSRVRLVVSSPAGFPQEISSVTPFLYDITYYKGEA